MSTPKVGDWVRIINSKDTLVKENALGVIEGYPLGRPMREETEEQLGDLICFNFSAFIGADIDWERDENGHYISPPKRIYPPCMVSCSGGPAYHIPSPKWLKPAGRREDHWAWNWRDGIPHADNARHYQRAADVWILDASQFRSGSWP
jgi:hypothetical protein